MSPTDVPVSGIGTSTSAGAPTAAAISSGLVGHAGGAAALAVAQYRGSAVLMAVLIVAHYATSSARIDWLVRS